MTESRVIGALLAASGGRIDIPEGVWEQLPFSPMIRTWRSDGHQTYVWALEEPGLQEIQEREEEAAAQARADRLRADVDGMTSEAWTETRQLPFPDLFLRGYFQALKDVRAMAGCEPAPNGGPRSEIIDPDVPLPPEPETPASWTIP